MTVVELVPREHAPGPERSAARHVVRQLVRRPSFTLSLAVVVLWVVVAVAGPWLPLHPDAVAGIPVRPPGPAHPFGTDNLGRDELARVLAGARPILQVAPAATAAAMVAGTVIGLYAAWYRGVVEEVLMRACDVVTAFPGIIAVVLIVSAFGRSVVTTLLAIALFFTPLVARTVRAVALVQRDQQYTEAARLQGERGPYVMFAEILPNIVPAVVIEATLRLGQAVFLDAGLSFLGLGAQPPSPDWGLAVTQNLVLIQRAWWTELFPAGAIASLVVAVNLIADNLRERVRP